MDRQGIVSQLQGLIGDFLKEQGFLLVELSYHYEGTRLVLRILTDRPESGINLDECSALNQQLGSFLDERGILQESYLLEVSSPGLDRPLRTKEDFLRCLGTLAQCFLKEPVGGKIEWTGKIIKLEGESLFIESGELTLEIPLAKVNKAKQQI